MPPSFNTAARAATVRTGRHIVLASLLLFAALAACWKNTLAPDTHRLSLFFQDNINGLDTGSPVKAHGVTVGQVEALAIRLPTTPDTTFYVEVRVALNGRAMEALGLPGNLAAPAHLKNEIEKGLRGKLVLISPMTGEFGVELAHAPDVPPIFATPATEGRAEIPVIPNVLSGEKLDTFSDALAAFSQRDFPAFEREWNAVLDASLAACEPARLRTFFDANLHRLRTANALLRDPATTTDLRTLNTNLHRLQTTLNTATIGNPTTTLAADLAAVRASLTTINARLAAFTALLAPTSAPVLDFRALLETTRATLHDLTPK